MRSPSATYWPWLEPISTTWPEVSTRRATSRLASVRPVTVSATV